MTYLAIVVGIIVVAVVAYMLGRNANAALPDTNLARPALSTASAASSSVKSSPDTEAKLDAARAELSAAKEDIAKRKKEIEELREQAKQKARREGKKEQAQTMTESKGPDPRDVEIQSLRKGMAGLESQLNNIKLERETVLTQAEKSDESSRRVVDDAKKDAMGERERRTSSKRPSTSCATRSKNKTRDPTSPARR
jgi:chromosome segregation ATPase